MHGIATLGFLNRASAEARASRTILAPTPIQGRAHKEFFLFHIDGYEFAIHNEPHYPAHGNPLLTVEYCGNFQPATPENAPLQPVFNAKLAGVIYSGVPLATVIELAESVGIDVAPHINEYFGNKPACIVKNCHFEGNVTISTAQLEGEPTVGNQSISTPPAVDSVVLPPPDLGADNETIDANGVDDVRDVLPSSQPDAAVSTIPAVPVSSPANS
jgi:hypothetical protein